jgi:hypothetical protein
LSPVSPNGIGGEYKINFELLLVDYGIGIQILAFPKSIEYFMNNKIDSISQFLTLSKFQYRIYDLGRKLTLLPHSLFEQIENQTVLYPYPFQQKAWLAVLFWSDTDASTNNEEPTVWFLHFPVDEMGYLKLASRDAFMQELLIHVGGNLQAQQNGQQMQDSLKESAFACKPRQDRLAIFHAFATCELKQPPSKYYQPTREYLTGKLGYEQWEFLGLQGISDIIARLHLDSNEHLLSNALPHLPRMPLIGFIEGLEHIPIKGKLALVLSKQLEQALNAEEIDSQMIAALTRGISSSKGTVARQKSIQQIAAHPAAKEVEVIASLASRAWYDITQPTILPLFLQALAHQPQEAFNVLLMDTMGIPNLREPILNGLRDPKRSELLSKRIGGFLARFS